jgi:hypothetical protein
MITSRERAPAGRVHGPQNRRTSRLKVAGDDRRGFRPQIRLAARLAALGVIAGLIIYVAHPAGAFWQQAYSRLGRG